MEPSLTLLAAIIFVAFLVGAVSGFGNAVIALSLGAHWFEVGDLVVRVVPLTLVLTAYLAIRHHTAVRWKLLWLEVLPLMGVGAAAGFLLVPQTPLLKVGLAVFVLAVSMRELLVAGTPVLNAPARVVVMLAAGVMHGVYATGGPLLVYALGKSQLDKSTFRATLSMVWFVLNIVMTGAYVVSGRLDAEVAMEVATLVPAVVVAIVIGEWLHHRVDEVAFRKLVFVLLALSSIALLVSTL